MAASSYYSTVQKAYIAFYGRPADPAGLTYWATRIDAAGGNISSIITAFGNSAEATALFGSMSNAQAVNTLYNQIFGRDADITGLNFYVGKLLDGSYTLVDIAQRIIDGATSGTDKTIVTNKLAAAQSFTDAIDTASEMIAYAGNDAAESARDWMSTVDSTTASVTAAQATISATLESLGTAITGETYTLTTSADGFTGTNANDLFVAGASRLSGDDSLNGGAGTDVLRATIGNGGSVGAPSLSNIEVLEITSRDASASIDLSNAAGYTAVKVDGTNNLAVSGLSYNPTVVITNQYSADLTLALAANTATAQLATLQVDSVNTAFDLVAATVDHLTINAVGDVGFGTGTQLAEASAITVLGNGDVTLNFNSANSGAKLSASFTAVNATALVGDLTLEVGSANAATTKVYGGSGNDKVVFADGAMSSEDSVDGNAGTDTVFADLGGGFVRPAISDVEILALRNDGTAATAGFSATDANLGQVDLYIGAAGEVSLDKVGSGVDTFNVNTAGSSAAHLTVSYGTAAVASDVVLNLGEGTSLFNTAMTATAATIGSVQFSGNSGSLTVNVNSTDNYTVDGITAFDFTGVTINASSGSLTVSSGVNTKSADTVVVNAAATKSVSFAEDLTMTGVETLTLNANGQSALIDIDTATLNNSVVLNINGSTSHTGNVGISADKLVLNNVTTADEVIDSTINIAAGASDVSIAILSLDASAAASGSVNATINASNTSTASTVTFGDVTVYDVHGGSSANEVNVNFSGVGSFVFSGNVASAGAVVWNIDTTGVVGGTAASVTIDLNGVANASAGGTSVGNIELGAHSAVVIGSCGIDTIAAGNAVQLIEGAGGADEITFNPGTAATYVVYDTDTAYAKGTANQDVVRGYDAGDVIVLRDLGTTAALRASGSFNTGTATTTTDIYTGGSLTGLTTKVDHGSGVEVSAAHWVAMYTANGNTILQIYNTAIATGADYASGQITYVTLEGEAAPGAASAFVKLDISSTYSGLTVTFL